MSNKLQNKWHFIVIILLISLILIFVYMSGYVQWNNNNKEKKEDLEFIQPELIENSKIKYLISNQEDFKKITVPDDMTLYYFPDKCPDYKKNIFIHIVLNGLDKYFIPEEKTLILVKKDHKWINEPVGFVYWTNLVK